MPNPVMIDDDFDGPQTPEGHTEPKAEPQVNHRIQEVIGQGLRSMYESLKAEPIPDHLLELLKKLDQPQRDESQ
ncbi:MAG TPA: NepR family anti-sigma factor [Microvirga sp.]|nr:NepR family anti-sigma factor [Microvirga sp.]